MRFAAIVLDQQFVERLKERHEFLQAAGEGAGGQLVAGAAKFGEDAIERLEEHELVLQDHHPEGDADSALGNELVGRRRREEGGRARTLTAAAIALAVIASAMGTDLDFEDVAVGGAGNFLERQLTSGTAFLVVG